MIIRLVRNVLEPHGAEIFRAWPSVIDFLEAEFPGGMPVRVYDAGTLEEIDPDLWAVPDAAPDVVVVVAPRGTELIVAAIIAAVVAVAASLVVAMAFGAASPTRDQEASPTYSLNLPTNQSRLDKVIPVPFGSVTTTPDLASAPYREFVDNEEYVFALLCLGPCEVDVNDVLIEQTSASGLPPGVFEWQKFAPADHAGTMGTIEASFGLVENVITSAVVSDAELTAPDAAEVSAATFARRADFIAPDTIRVYGVLLESDGIEDGVGIDVTGTTSNNVSFTVSGDPVESATHFDITVAETVTSESVAAAAFLTTPSSATTSAALGRLVVRWRTGPLATVSDENGTNPVDPTPLPAALGVGLDVVVDYNSTTVASRVHSGSVVTTAVVTGMSADNEIIEYFADYEVHLDLPSGVSPATTTGVVVFKTQGVAATFAIGLSAPYIRGWYAASRPGVYGTEIALDFLFPSGLYRRNSSTGALASRSVEVKVERQEIDDTGNPVGAVTSQTFTYTRANNTPYRVTEKITVASGRYRVRAQRVTLTSSDAADQDRLVWSGLKFRANNAAGTVYQGCTLLATKARASAGLSGGALRQIKVDMTRRLPVLGSLNYTPASQGAFNSIADVAQDLLFNPDYGAGFDSSFVDLASFNSTRVELLAAGVPGFNGVIDTARPTFELLREIGGHALVEPLYRASGLGLVIDSPRAARSYVFSPANIVEGTFRRSYRTRGVEPHDSIEVGYFDFVTGSTEWIRWPTAGAFPRRVDLSHSLTDSAHALDVAKVTHAAVPLNDQAVEFEVELDGRIIEYLDRVGVSWPLWGTRRIARARLVSALSITLDRAPPDLSGSVWVMLVGDDGTPAGPIAATLVGEILVLDSSPGFTIHGEDSDYTPTPVMLAPLSSVVEDFTIIGAEPTEGGRVRISARRYDAARWAGTAFAGISL